MDDKPVASTIRPGTRVVRGPDWASKRQDNGEGFVGTIIYVPKHGSNDHKVTVIWDSGLERRYRAGQDGKYDLRVFDSAPSGEVHKHIVCDVCNEQDVKGLRWKCTDCDDFDLCTICYMNDKHKKEHGFVRIDSQHSSAVPVPPRNKSQALKAFGLYPNTEVMRGPHWKWKNDDGGEGQEGKIQEVVTWAGKYHRGGVRVQWQTDSSVKEYRVGGEGCVDVIYIRKESVTSGGKYYPDHLPVVDVDKPGIIFLKSGDKVQVNLTVKAFRQLQDNAMYGGWEEGMEQCIGELGTIVQILFQGKTCRVQYTDGRTWSINRVALTRVHTFSTGDAITVLSDYNAVVDLQEGHGGWNDDMKSALGAKGRIKDIDRDGDILVTIGNNTWIFSPVCIMPLENGDDVAEIPAIPAKKSTTQQKKASETVNEAMAKLGGHLKEKQRSQVEDITSIAQAVTEGDIQTVKTIIRKHPNMVNETFDGKTALHLACYEGFIDIVKLLLESKAKPDLQDSEGDSPLHFSAYGNEPNAMVELLKNKPNVDIVNKKKQTPLHIAVGLNGTECVKILLKAKANPSLKDCDGDTPMHIEIAKKNDQSDILKDLLESDLAKFTQTNADGFNVLHWAAMNNLKSATEIILKKSPKIVNEPLAEGLTALHLAAVNNCLETANVLLRSGHCDVNAVDKTKRTPLIMCVSQGHQQMMELLIAAGSKVNVQDSDGNTALHVAMLIKALPTQQEMDTEILCALLEAKADIDIKNKKGLQPLDLAEDEKTKKFMISLAKKAKGKTLQTTKRGIGIPPDWEPTTPSVIFKRVVLSPNAGGLMEKEYKMVAEKFNKTLGQAKILQIERIQNVHYWEIFQLKRRQLENIYGGIGCANEKDLFHGTLTTYIDDICRDNFDFRIAGERTGAIFGQGAYFARDAKYSDLYAGADTDKNKYMFLAKALCGKCAVGDKSYKRPPPINPTDPHPDLYDCCVDRLDDPSIFCIFDKSQYYPHYLIKYK